MLIEIVYTPDVGVQKNGMFCRRSMLAFSTGPVYVWSAPTVYTGRRDTATTPLESRGQAAKVDLISAYYVSPVN